MTQVTKEDIFDRVYRSLYKTFSTGIERYPLHPYWRHKFCRTYNELDLYLSKELGEDWIREPWAKYWLGNHFLFERTLVRHEVLNSRGPVYRKRTPGSIRDKREREGPKQLHRRVPNHILAGFIEKLKEQDITTLRKISKSIEAEYGISLRKDTVRRIKKKYNI